MVSKTYSMLDTWLNYDQVKWNYVSEHLKTFWTLGRDQSRPRLIPPTFGSYSIDLEYRRARRKKVQRKKKEQAKELIFGGYK